MIRAIAFLVGFCCPSRRWPELYGWAFTLALSQRLAFDLGVAVFVSHSTGEDLKLMGMVDSFVAEATALGKQFWMETVEPS